MREQPPGDAGLALHRTEIALAVLAPQRQPGDEVVEDELVQHDDAGPLPQRLDDPAVRIRRVADVVERDVGATAAAQVTVLDDLHVEPSVPSAGRRSAL